MKKLIFIILTITVMGSSSEYVGDITSMSHRNGQLMKNDGTVVNEVDSTTTVQLTQDLSAAALNYTSTFDKSLKIIGIYIHTDVAVTETVTISKVFTTATYTTLIRTVSLSGNQDIFYNNPVYLDSDSEINITCTNATATTNIRVTLIYSEVVR